jgi:hypothetical protein
MQRPTWGTVIGILMIAFGGCSVLNNIQAISLPSTLEAETIRLKKEIDKEASDTLREETSDTLTISNTEPIKKTKKEEKFDIAKKALELSEETKIWIVRFGYIGILISIIYATAGVFLLSPRKISIKLVYAALIVSIAYSATKTIVLTSQGSASGVIALTMGATQLFGILIDVILLSIVFSSDQEAYTGK